VRSVKKKYVAQDRAVNCVIAAGIAAVAYGLIQAFGS